MSSLAQPRYTPQEYLALEHEAPYKSEFINGQIYAMAGAKPVHVLITSNINGTLWSQLKGKPCATYSSDLRVKVIETDMYTYPDVVIVCGEPRFDALDANTLVNPTVIIEVLSRSTEAHDRGAKFAHYRMLDTFVEYVLVAQDKPCVERFARQPDGQWLYSVADDLRATVPLAAIGCELALAEAYDKVDFVSQAETGETR